jgi:tetratricopeptide (TPR) repeat protein
MSKFDAVYRLPVLIFFASVFAIPGNVSAIQDNSGSETADRTAASSASTTASSATASSPTKEVDPSAAGQPEGSAPSRTSNPAAQTGLTYIPTAPPPTQEQIGDSLSVRQRYHAAIDAYSKVKPPTAAVWNKMGIAYQMMFDNKDAIRCYKESLKLDRRNAQVLNNLATVYDSERDYRKAEKLYRKALKIDPKSALIHRNLGSNLMSQHKYKKGAKAYGDALAINPQIFSSHAAASVQNPATAKERGAVHYYMAKGCVSAGNSECAIRNLRLALNEGYISPKKAASDEAFASIRELPGFKQLIASQTPQ